MPHSSHGSPDIRLTPYRDHHAGDVAAIHDAAHDACPTFPALSAASWRQFAGASFNRGAQDFVVADAGGRTVGILSSTSWLEGSASIRHFRVVVHPEVRRRGIGRALFGAAEAQARAEGAVLQSNCHESWPAGVAFLEALGFAPHASVHVMRCDRPTQAVNAPPPRAVRFRLARITGEDDAAWLEISNAAYAHDPTVSELHASDLPLLREAEGFELVLAEANGESVALCHTRSLLGDGAAVIASVAVHPSAVAAGWVVRSSAKRCAGYAREASAASSSR